MERLLARAHEDASAILTRNRAALDELIARLTTPTDPSTPLDSFPGNTLDGAEVRRIVEQLGDPTDLARRQAEEAAFL